MPAVEAQLASFRAAHTQVLGVSVDSIYCHANWARDLGGISFPLLSDFHPKGAVSRAYGVYLEEAGISDRATVFIDASGVVRHASSVTPSGERKIPDLLALAEQIDRDYKEKLSPFPKPTGLGADSVLYIKSRCGFSKATLLARDNLHLQDVLPLRNVTEDPEAMETLRKLTGKEQAPCLVTGGKVLLESKDIIRLLVSATSGLP